ncbi:hypothetical protein HMPREF9946_02205 [Acetobacteraceae bacterium AT-5844]|nr:hypothetical protein HMPREF9946_02205 [Acetobacteraceae bacterium AT-5844]
MGIGCGFSFLWPVKYSASTSKAKAERKAVSDIVWNERVKLLAAALDRMSTACMSVGIATPAASYVFNDGTVPYRLSAGIMALTFAGWSIVAVGCHLAARKALGGLRG